MSGYSLFSRHDAVVLVDERGHVRRDAQGKPLRGVVMRALWHGELVVSLDRSGRQERVHQTRVRRCPALAYVRSPLEGNA